VPGPQGEVKQKTSGSKTALAKEAVHLRQLKIDLVGDRFHGDKRQSMPLGRAQDRGRFHVYRMRPVGLSQLLLLAPAGDSWMAGKNRAPQSARANDSLRDRRFMAAAVLRIDD
jgi:hypothetical protein